MKKILYYVSGNGMGHATRSLALIEGIRKNNVNVVIRTYGIESFFKKEVPKIKIISDKVDVGSTIRLDGISIDRKKTIMNQKKWIHSIEKYSDLEKNIIVKENPDLIISDVSAMPLVAAKKAQKKSLIISNFTWFDLFDFLPQKELIMLRNAYDCADTVFRLPFGTKMDHFKKIIDVGLVARIPKQNKNNLRNNLGVKKEEKIVTISLGNYQKKIKPKFAENIKVISLGTKIEGNNIIKISKNIPGHEIVSISDLVICKCGYGFVSECVSNNIPFFTIFSKKHNEQISIIKKLESFGFHNTINLKEINDLLITDKFIESIKPIKRIRVENTKVLKKIMELI